MKKIFFSLLTVVLVVVAVRPVYAAEWATISNTWYGDLNPLPLHKNVVKGVLVQNVDPARIAHDVGATFEYGGPLYPHTEDTVDLKSFIVYKNGSVICRFGPKDLKEPVTCMVGDLKPRETIDMKIFFKSHKTGEFLFMFYVSHDGIVTEGGHVATFVGY